MEYFNFFNGPILSVSELTHYLRQLLEADQVLQDIWVRGEISNFSQPRSGHLYFTLKDSDSAIRCVMWKGQAMRLHFEARDGLAVEAHGSMNIYEAGGQVQLYVDSMRPAGEGALYQEFLRLKAKLASEGLFDESHKRPIPSYPKTIGLVTSPTGAALQDILNTLRRRYPLAKVILSETTVQGNEAPAGIVSALNALNHQVNPDVIILARGGGSIEDLWAFNTEEVARAIYQSKAPIISGVGHETDFTIADFTADLRAPTPTAAAELATPHPLTEIITTLDESALYLTNLIMDKFAQLHLNLADITIQIKNLSPQMQINIYRQRLDEFLSRSERALYTRHHSHRLRLESLSSRLSSLDPHAVLGRGYAIVTHLADNTVISRVEQAATGAKVKLQVSNGAMHAEIEKIFPGEI